MGHAYEDTNPALSMESTAKISILVPVRNEEQFIEECLESILTFEGLEFVSEIFIVDGDSTDSTAEKVKAFAIKDPRIQLLHNPARIVPTALNLGIRKATGDFILRLDAHSSYPKDYMMSVLRLLQSTGAGNAGGRVINVASGDSPWAEPIAKVTAHPFGVGNGAFRIGGKASFVDTVPFGIFKREIFDEVGLFDERLTRNQDNEFNARLRKAGYKIAFDPDIKVTYKNQSKFTGLMRQAFFTGMWNVYTLTLLPYTFKWRRFVPALFFLYLTALAMAALVLPAPFVLALFCPLALYIVLDAVISVRISRYIREAFRVFLLFFSYHFTYGAGTMWGVVQLATGNWRNYIGRSIKR